MGRQSRDLEKLIAMLRRTPFKQPAKPERKPIAWPGKVRAGNQARCDDMGVAQPKGDKAKPGKRTPTAEERRWMDFIVGYGCIACRLDGWQSQGLPCAVHHIVDGGRRLGHLFTLPLCDPGHHQNGERFGIGIVSRHPWKARFEEKYGTEQQLLEILRKEYAAQSGRA